MRSLLLASLLLFSIDLHAQAQHLQVYAGYSLLRPKLPAGVAGGDKTAHDLGEFSLNNVLGWNTGATFHLRGSLGLTADISGYYRSLNTQIDGFDVRGKMNAHMFLFGPTYTRKGDRVQPFARVLAGVGHLHAEGTVDTDHTEGTSTAFAAAVGGGVDFAVNERFAVRAFQFDYFPVRDSHRGGLTFHNVRWGTGVVFTLR